LGPFHSDPGIGPFKGDFIKDGIAANFAVHDHFLVTSFFGIKNHVKLFSTVRTMN